MKAFASKRIILALSTPKTRFELIRITRLPDRTLRYNIAILKKKNLVKEAPIFTDMRTKMFALTSRGSENV